MLSFLKPAIRVDQFNLNSPSTGSSLNVILGTSYGSVVSPAVRLGHSACQTSTWSSDSSLVCRTSSSNGHRLAVSTTIAQQIHSVHDLFSIDVSKILSAVPAVFPTSGTVSVTMTGHNLGCYHSSHFVRVGVSSSPAHLWISTSHIVNKVPSGSLVTVDTIVSISHVNGKQNNMLSFLAPLLTVTTMSNSPTSGSVHLRVFGAQLGAAGYSPKLFSQHTQSERTSWLSDSIISSKISDLFIYVVIIAIVIVIVIGIGIIVVLHVF